jgi:hypothetical protein
LSCRRDGNFVNALMWQIRVSIKQSADGAHDEVVGSGFGVKASGLAKGGADGIYKVYILRLLAHMFSCIAVIAPGYSSVT